MARSPGSQRRAVMEAKREQIQRLLAQGLSVAQVSGQVNCSRVFVRKVRAEMGEEHEQAG